MIAIASFPPRILELQPGTPEYIVLTKWLMLPLPADWRFSAEGRFSKTRSVDNVFAENLYFINANTQVVMLEGRRWDHP